MAALNFPTSPALNDVYTANGKAWYWNGVSWVSQNSVSPSLITAGKNTVVTTVPNGVSVGQKVVKATIIGDSLSAANNMRSQHWIDILTDTINKFGDNIEITSLAIGGSTYYSAYTTTSYSGNTMVQECIATAPDLVIVVMGLNDVSSGRSQAQIKADALNVYTALRTGLPSAKIFYVSERFYDSTNFTPSTVKNKGMIPINFNLPAAGILTGCYSSEVLDTVVSTAVQTKVTDWVALDTYIKGFSQVDAYCTYDHWLVARLGLFLTDGLHQNLEGSRVLANDVMYGLINASFSTTLLPNFVREGVPVLGTSSALKTIFLTASGDGYTTNLSDNNNLYSYEAGPFRQFNTDTWFMPFKGTLRISNTTITDDLYSITTVSLENVKPNTLLEKSVNGGAFSTSSQYTDNFGKIDLVLPGRDFTAGTYVMRVRVGTEVYGPFTITVNASAGINGTAIGGTTPAVGSFTTLSATGNVTLGDASTDTFNVGNGGLVKDASGNVGIGTSSPSQKLTVLVADAAQAASFQAATGRVRLRPYVDATSGAVFEATNTTESAFIPLTIEGQTLKLSSSGGSINIDTAGKVGIGTSSPVTSLDVTGGSPILSVNDNGANKSQVFMQASNVGNYIGSATVGGTTQALHLYVGTVKATIDTSGNFGLNLTPSTWDFKAFEFGSLGNALWSTASNDVRLSANTNYNSGYKYTTTNTASMYTTSGGKHYWYTAPSGTAGTAITWTQSMVLDASSNLGIGGTPSAWYATNGTYKAIQINSFGSLAGYATYGGVELSANCYPTADNVYAYTSTYLSTRYRQAAGEHSWYNAPSGTADTTITFTKAMTLDTSSNLSIAGSVRELKSAPSISTNTLTLNLNTGGSVFEVALNANITTLTISNPPTSGTSITFILAFVADGTPRTVTWPASVKWAGGTAPTLTATNAKKDIFTFTTYDGGTTYYATIVGQNF